MLLMVQKYKESIYFGLALAILFFFVKWIEIHFVLYSQNIETYIFLIALLFTALGIWLANTISTTKIQTVIVKKEIYISQNFPFEVNQKEIENRKISKRELEVLTLIADGKSNQEIADSLFVAIPTIKTHITNLFEKLEAKRRTQAIETAKRLQLIR